MDCLYINLDSQIDRRDSIEGSFNRNKADGWSLSRFSAIDMTYVEANNIQGSLRGGEKGCFLSHMNIVAQNMEDNEPLFLLEDDAVFGSQTCNVVNMVLEHYKSVEWDIIFTDVCVPSVGTMYDLFKLRQELKRSGDIRMLDLAGIPFAGSTAYIVNGKSKKKLHELFSSLQELNIPYDLWLRKLARESALKVFSIFPFVTTLSTSADSSEIQETSTQATEMVWNMYRRLVWLESDFNEIRPFFDLLNKSVEDEEAAALGTLVSLMSSEMFQVK